MRNLIRGLMLASAGFTISTSAAAATIVYEGKCQQFCNLNQVNGSVNSVSYTFEYSSYQTFASNGSSADGPPVYRATGTFRVSGGQDVNYSYLVSGQDTGNSVSLYYNYPISQELTGDLSYYEGFGTFEIGASTMPILTYVSGQYADTNNLIGGRPFDSAYRIVIDYTPAVPEPTTWALMLTGFAMTSYAMRRRRVAFAHS